ncbi:Yip1 domain protein [Gregarina niphandrodes]|uniref:Protein YIPF n=1 Tax=Gregarina niphandrodes TaxID=110365 RepID=A0A023B0H8_GRENI|nr:Yip1 domain protein [Gregarina niphandrodes]EZG44309.1 Yip1 domain protein [Gregarina niphandrodes]|eukprot:XP_011132717.1 Yip1 domain protein [Gregarina niphandrodes]
MEEEEAPLLEELGIIPRDILRRTLCVLTFRKVGDEMLDSMDMTGPVLILLGLGCSCLLLSGKVHFEYVYGLMTGGTFGVWALLNLMSRSKLLSIHRTISVLGYGLLPILLVSFLAPFTKLKPYVATAGVLWSTSTASRFVEEALDMQAQRYLAAYPIMLFYICFTFITVL